MVPKGFAEKYEISLRSCLFVRGLNPGSLRFPRTSYEQTSLPRGLTTPSTRFMSQKQNRLHSFSEDLGTKARNY